MTWLKRFWHPFTSFLQYGVHNGVLVNPQNRTGGTNSKLCKISDKKAGPRPDTFPLKTNAQKTDFLSKTCLIVISC